MEIRMIGMDFDNTLIDNSSGKPYICRELMEWLSLFIKAGNYAGIVSGRNENEMKEILEYTGYKWGMPFPNFCIHRESFFNTIYDGKDVSYEEHNGPARVRISNNMLTAGGYAAKWSKEMECEGLLIKSWNLYGDFGLEFALPDLQQAQSAVELLEKCILESGLKDFQVHRNGKLATVIDKKSGKGNVLLKAAQYYGLAPCQVLAVGDSINDLSMVDGQKGFVGASVGNGDELLKKSVLAGGGYIGNGTASAGIIDVIKQLSEEGRIKTLYKDVLNDEAKCLV